MRYIYIDFTVHCRGEIYRLEYPPWNWKIPLTSDGSWQDPFLFPYWIGYFPQVYSHLDKLNSNTSLKVISNAEVVSLLQTVNKKQGSEETREDFRSALVKEYMNWLTKKPYWILFERQKRIDILQVASIWTFVRAHQADFTRPWGECRADLTDLKPRFAVCFVQPDKRL